jgi:hypothetical protein
MNKKPMLILEPLPPTHLFDTENKKWVSIKCFNETQLKKMGKEWTKSLIALSKK